MAYYSFEGNPIYTNKTTTISFSKKGAYADVEESYPFMMPILLDTVVNSLKDPECVKIVKNDDMSSAFI